MAECLQQKSYSFSTLMFALILYSVSSVSCVAAVFTTDCNTPEASHSVISVSGQVLRAPVARTLFPSIVSMLHVQLVLFLVDPTSFGCYFLGFYS